MYQNPQGQSSEKEREWLICKETSKEAQSSSSEPVDAALSKDAQVRRPPSTTQDFLTIYRKAEEGGYGEQVLRPQRQGPDARTTATEAARVGSGFFIESCREQNSADTRSQALNQALHFWP